MVNVPERLSVKLALLISGLLASMAANAAPPTSAPSCQTATLNDEEGEAVCALPASTSVREFQFKVRFLGSHDDSEVSLRLIELNGVPVECRADSKTKSKFEDGVVTLDCSFTAPAKRSDGRLNVRISVHHLQLDNAELLVR